MTISEGEFEEATRRGQELKESAPAAVSVRFDRGGGLLVIVLSSGDEVFVSPKLVRGLEDASPEDLDSGEVFYLGFAIRFPTIDADVYLPDLIARRER